MKQQNTNQERKTFKEVVKENKGKIMIIGGAVVTVTRKRDTLVSKLNCYNNMPQLTDDIVNKIKETKAGIAGFDNMLDQYDELEYLYKCRVIGENLLDK